MSIVVTEDRESVRHVILNRPEKRNALNGELTAALHDALRAAAADDDVRCVVIRGEGKVFSAGIDLAWLAGSGPGGLRGTRTALLDAFNACEEMLKPTIAQIHGACIGAALELSLACDLRVSTTDAQMGLSETRLGLVPDVGGSSRLPAVVGLGRAKELIMTSRLIDGVEAERISLVNKVASAEELENVTGALVAELLGCNPLAVGRAKRLLDSIAKPCLAANLEQEVLTQELCVADLMRAAEATA